MFFSDPTIFIPSQLVFPVEQISGNFTTEVITTRRVTSIRVERSDGVAAESEILTELLSYKPQKARYLVKFPWLQVDLSGVYTISVTNAAQQSATASVHVTVSTSEFISIQ